MFPKLLAGSVAALTVGQTYAAGYAWSGVNMGGFDFGCTTDGFCELQRVDPPLNPTLGKDGPAQMKHFVENDGLNAFRLPVGWQYLVNNKLGGTLDSTAMGKYDELMQACLDTGAYCIIDIHNYARWDGEIIGQGGPKDSDFASLWSQLGKQYAKQPKVVMGIVNEPHDIPDLAIWATSVQAAVTEIRKAGATEHTILLPGTGYTSAESFVSSKSGPELAKVTNLDGSTDNLVFDVHKYLDFDNTGTHTACDGSDINVAFKPLANWLRQEKRQALLSEIGGGSQNPSCMTHVCEVADYLNENSDVYLGMLGWAAGSFDPDAYVLSLTPHVDKDSKKMTDQPLLTKCFVEKFKGGSGGGSSSDSGTGSGTGSGSGSGSGPASGSETTAPATGASSTAVAQEPASSQTQYPADTTAAESVAATSTSTAAAMTSSSAALGGGLDNLGDGGPGASTPPATTSSSTTSAMVQMPSGAHMPVPVGAVNSWGFQNASTAAGPTGTGVPAPSITMPMGYQPTTLQTVVASSSQAPVPGTTDSQGNPGGQVQQDGLSGGLNNLGAGGEEGEEECDWVED